MLQSAVFGRAIFGRMIFGSAITPPPLVISPAPPQRTFLVPPQYGDIWLGTKTPEELINFSFNWFGAIAQDLIATSIWELESGDVSTPGNAVDATGTIATILISGGLPASIYNITNLVTLTSGLKLDATFRLIVNAYNY